MLKLFFIGFLGVLIPGPDMLLVIRTSLLDGYKKSLLVLLGILTGNFIYVLPVILGYSLLIKEFIPFVMLLGGLYILYLSFLILKEKPTKNIQDNKKNFIKSYYFIGLLTNLSNPKAMLYFASVLLPILIESKERFYFYIFSFFIGVVIAFLFLIFFANSIQNLRNNDYFIRFINFLFFLVFFSYGIYLIFFSFNSFISNHIFHILKKGGIFFG
jgi:threonine/homoserine/homoserine lactone efflux protein